jgi:type I restriction enzyme S subunit
MIAWKRIALSELVESVTYGVTASASMNQAGPKFLRITDIQENGVNWESVPWCECDARTMQAAQLRSGDIVFARTGATTGKSFLVHACPAMAVFASYLIRVRAGKKVEPRYLSHFFQTDDYWTQISKGTRGAAQPGVNATTLKALEVPFPDIADQRRIAAILDQADALRVKRRETLAQLDSLTQAIFIEMFGEPNGNSFNWPLATLGDLILSATDGPHVSPKYSEKGVPFLSTRHVRRGEVSWADLKYISKEEALIQWKKCKPEHGDILYTKGGTTGLAAVVNTNEAFAIWVHVALLKPNTAKVTPIWLEAMLNSDYCYRQSQDLTHGIANRDLGLKRMVRIAMFAPPISLQRKFESCVAVLNNLKFEQRQSLTQLDTLFASLQHRAFRGEL